MDIEPELFEKILKVIYGLKVEINGLKTLELIKLIQFFDIKGINIDDIIMKIKIDKENLPIYIKLLSEIYPYEIPLTIINIMRHHITPETNISVLPEASQKLLR